ncbi:MAG: EAL domain-containing protein [Burkholderiaceae bacterium]
MVTPPRLLDDERRRQLMIGGALIVALLIGALAWLLPGVEAGTGAAAWLPWLLAGALAIGLGFMIFRQRDLTARQARLRTRIGHHDQAEVMAGLGLWSLDPYSGRMNYSRGARRVLGLDLAGQGPDLERFLDRIHADDRQAWAERHQAIMENPGETRLEFRMRLDDGGERWVRSIARTVQDGRGEEVLGVQGTVQDISGQRAMQRELATSEAKFRELTHMGSDWVWETDAEHRLSYLSESVDTTLGHWARRHLGRTRWDAARQDALPNDWARLEAMQRAHESFQQFECSRLDDQQRIVHLVLNGHPVFDEQGRFRGYRGTGRDITREKQQRILLEIDGDMAAIMREQSDPSRVLSAVIITVCGKLSWLGGVHLSTHAGGAIAREHWGTPAFSQVVASIDAPLAIDDVTVEARAFRDGKAIWLPRAELESEFAKRWHIRQIKARAAFLAPIVDEQNRVMSVLLFLAPVGFRGDEFLGEIAALLSRALSLYLRRNQAEQRLRRASQFDALTKLPNRAYVGERLESMLAAGKPLALLYIDLDRYKLINDTLGHAAGDKALIEVARRLDGDLPEGGFAGRMGGDEFVVVVPELATREAVEPIARRLLREIEQPIVLAERAYFISASIGVAFAPADATEASLLMQAADAAMYRVKSESRNDVRFFSGDLRQSERARQLRLAGELPLALQRDELDLYYQPVMDIGQRRVHSIEGLLRWRHPEHGLLRPDSFLPMAEESNLIREIGIWTLRRAIDDRIALGIDRFEQMAVSVNISVRQLAEEGFLETLLGLVRERGLPPHLLKLELTESSFIENPQRTVRQISDLRRAGVRCMIDNFGTGYASLSYIKNLPVDGLKIDRAFVRDLPEDRGNAAIVQAVTTLAARLGMEAIAEGVETAGELRGLRALQCDLMQGSLIAEPMPFAELGEFVESLPGLRRMYLVDGSREA